jgi:hypothetical protein
MYDRAVGVSTKSGPAALAACVVRDPVLEVGRNFESTPGGRSAEVSLVVSWFVRIDFIYDPLILHTDVCYGLHTVTT